MVGLILGWAEPRLRQLSHPFSLCQGWKDALTKRKGVRAQKQSGVARVGGWKNLPARNDGERCEWRPGARKGKAGKARCELGPGAEHS